MVGWLLFACGTMPDAPKVKVEPISAQTMRVRMFAPHGKPRLVNFWATWCGPCVAELPRIRNWAEAHPGYEVVMVDLDLPNRREEAVVPFIEREGIGHFTHWQIVDPDPTMALGRILPDWPDQIPVTYVVSRQGTVTHRFARALTEADLAALK